MKLLIVESPTKSKKLSQFLGSDYRIAASFGHVRDLPPSGGLAVRFADGAVEPSYQVIERSRKAVTELKQLAARAEEILLATDPDREGEAIAWHVAELLGITDKCKRVTFNAITKQAVLAAVAAPRDLDDGLVGAQQARRVLDRVVGWVVSPTLSRGLRDRAARSAGRVQSVALRLVAEREREIQAFTAVDYFILEAKLSHETKPPPFTARLVEWKGEALEHRLQDQAIAEQTVDWCRKQSWQVAQVDRREQQRHAPPPFVTATVQQAASVRLKFTPAHTMKLLQQLFENGHITYHRTDSVAVAPEAITAARALIQSRFPADYLPEKPNQHAAKSSNTQEAHEAIRPTHPESGRDAVGSDDAGRLYRLIWERFIASQMAPGRDFLTTIRVDVAPAGFTHPTRGQIAMGQFEAKGKVVLFDGWRKLTDDTTTEKKGKAKGKDSEEVAELPDVTVGDQLTLEELGATRRSTKAPPRYTQASLIKKLEAEGIGRPSTYAAIMSTIMGRDYVDERKRKLHCTELGLKVTDFLVERFAGNFIDIDFTVRMEDRLDAIARGEENWQLAVTEASFAVRDLAQRAGLSWDPLSGEAPPKREPAKADPDAEPCPLCTGPMTKRSGRFGTFFSCLDYECDGTRDADGSIGRKSQRILAERAEGKQLKPKTRSKSAPKTPSRPRSKTGRTSRRLSVKASANPNEPTCPECGSSMIAGTSGDGRALWSCCRFPSCRGERLRE